MTDFIMAVAVNLPGFLIGIVFHEAAHAYVAYKFGDQTAKMAGRLSLNPLVHYDLVGTIIFPAVGALLGGVMFGWAKPVPVNPRYFRNVRGGIFWVSFAGPLANILIAIICAFLFALLATQVPQNFAFYTTFLAMLKQALLINLVLATFNLIPFPPLDGSKMVSSFLSYEQANRYEELGKYSFIFIILLWTTDIFQVLMRPVIHFGINMTHFFLQAMG